MKIENSLGRILCIDYGKKRCGVAVTDPLQIIATSVDTIETQTLIYWLKGYFASEAVDLVLIGYPLDLNQQETDATPLVQKFVRNFKKVFPSMEIMLVDEQYTSKMAVDAMLEMGMKKKQRQQKGNIDLLSATIMLQDYLANR